MTNHRYPKELLGEIEQCIENDEFKVIDSAAFHEKEVDGAVGYTISTDTWKFVVVEFGAPYGAGVPTGTKGYDGTAFKRGCVIRLPANLAEKAFKKASTP